MTFLLCPQQAITRKHMTDDTNPLDGILRRTVMKASTVGAGALAASGTATARNDNDDDAATDENNVDEPDGFEVEVVGEYATFPDEVGATFALMFDDENGDDDGDDGTMGSHHTLDDGSTLVVADVI